MKFNSKFMVLLLVLNLLNGCILEKQFRFPAQIRQQGDLPCFAIESNRETRRVPLAVVSVSVYGYNFVELPQKGAAQEVWTHRYFNADDEYPHTTSYFITPNQCILYNDDGKAPALEVGKRYEVFVSTIIDQMESGERRFFDGYFCLSKDRSGNMVVHQVEWDNRKEGFNWDMCH